MDKNQAQMDFEIKSFLATTLQERITAKDSNVSLAKLVHILWSRKLLIMFVTALFSISAVVFSLNQPNIYRSSALLAPSSSESTSGLNGLAGQFGGLASLAGISIGSGGSDKTALALEVLKTRKFIFNFIEKYDISAELYAVKGFDRSANELVYNPDLYVENSWLDEDIKPSKQDLYEAFRDILYINQDKTTGFVTIEIEHISPVIAKNWLNLLISEINSTIKLRDQKDAFASIEYLKEQLNQTEVASMQSVFYQLIEEQIKNVMLTQIKDDYVLEVIDPPDIPERKVKPKRALIVVLWSILGILFAIVYVLLSFFTKLESKQSDVELENSKINKAD